MNCQRVVSSNATRLLAGRRSLCSANLKQCVPPVIQSWRSIHITPRSIPACFRTPHVRHYAASPDVTEDPERKGLYYHPVGDNIFALSFLPEKPPRRDSATVIGLIPEDEGLSSFRENQAFVDLLHDTVKAALIEGVDQELINDATQRQEGWLHVHDLRNFPEMGRVGDPDDILGSVLVQEGKIKGDTYQRMPSYRTCTSDGPLKLTSSLHERLVKALKEAHQKESK